MREEQAARRTFVALVNKAAVISNDADKRAEMYFNKKLQPEECRDVLYEREKVKPRIVKPTMTMDLLAGKSRKNKVQKENGNWFAPFGSSDTPVRRRFPIPNEECSQQVTKPGVLRHLVFTKDQRELEGTNLRQSAEPSVVKETTEVTRRKCTSGQQSPATSGRDAIITSETLPTRVVPEGHHVSPKKQLATSSIAIENTSTSVIEKLKQAVQRPKDNVFKDLEFLLSIKENLVQMPEPDWKEIATKFGNFLGNSYVEMIDIERRTEHSSDPLLRMALRLGRERLKSKQIKSR